MNKYLFFLIVFVLSGCTSQAGNVQDTLNEGAKSFQQGNFDLAIQKYSEAVQIQPNNPIAYNLLGMAYRFKFNQTGAQEYKDKEIETFKKAVELDPKYWVAYKNLAASLYYQDRKKEAVPYLEK